jgi:hypothetical protein
MNLKLHHVLSDITGVTGMAIVRDTLAGVRDPYRLAAHHHGGCKASEQEIIAALTNYRVEHLFALPQNFEAFELSTANRGLRPSHRCSSRQSGTNPPGARTRAACGPAALQAQQERTARRAAATESDYWRRRPQSALEWASDS